GRGGGHRQAEVPAIGIHHQRRAAADRRAARGGRPRHRLGPRRRSPARRGQHRGSTMTDNTAAISPPPLPRGQPAGHHRVAIATTAATLAEHAATLQARGFRLALVAAHDDRDTLRAVYLYVA